MGYARVSTGDQDVAGQQMRLKEVGAIRVFTDVMSGKSMDQPGFAELLGYARKGDALAIVRLNRLGRLLSELLTIVNMLRESGIALRMACSARDLLSPRLDWQGEGQGRRPLDLPRCQPRRSLPPRPAARCRAPLDPRLAGHALSPAHC